MELTHDQKNRLLEKSSDDKFNDQIMSLLGFIDLLKIQSYSDISKVSDLRDVLITLYEKVCCLFPEEEMVQLEKLAEHIRKLPPPVWKNNGGNMMYNNNFVEPIRVSCRKLDLKIRILLQNVGMFARQETKKTKFN